jgi:ABC-type phosphate transport system substrate-binding protein
MNRGGVMILLVASLAQGVACAGEVIAHSSVNLSGDEIRDVFLGEKQLDGNLKLVPVDNAAIQSEFLSRVLQTDAQKYAARWTKKTFREGLAPPARKGSDAEVLEFVRTTPGAVGYVSRHWPGVKVLETF